jgi:pyrimidine-nucleoside phosphorylase
MGFKEPMISGRGLGITGGTLDKLEAIPGFRTDLSPSELHGVLQDVGCFISGQTGELAPADRILYGLRNETATVPSIPLITGSILSKKLAEGLDQLVLDVKWGSGAFMKTRTEARKLADSLVRVGSLAQVKVEAHLTEMSQPLGRAVGNSLEVEESIACLKGEGPRDLRDLVIKLSGEPEKAARVLDNGSAFRKFQAMVSAQGGDLDAPLKGQGCSRWTLAAPESGVVRRCDAQDIGQASFVVGAGRSRAKDPVHHGVGVLVHAHVGDSVTRGQALATLVYADKGLENARKHLKSAFVLES